MVLAVDEAEVGMFWWLFWSELMQRYAAPRPLPLQPAATGYAVQGVGGRRRPARNPSVLPIKVPAPRPPVLRLVCVDGVRIDRAASCPPSVSALQLTRPQLEHR